jgi:hypothetical protein
MKSWSATKEQNKKRPQIPQRYLGAICYYAAVLPRIALCCVFAAWVIPFLSAPDSGKSVANLSVAVACIAAVRGVILGVNLGLVWGETSHIHPKDNETSPKDNPSKTA